MRNIFEQLVNTIKVAAAWLAITCGVVGAWTIYREGFELLNPRAAQSEPRTVVIAPGGWDSPDEPVRLAKKR